MNKPPIILILMVSLVVSVGCAKKDWIDQTLVTADVTGTWRDVGGTIDLAMEQQGSKVTGSMTWRGSFTSASGTIFGAIEGTVAGDVFQFKQTGGPSIGVNGEMTVSGDEMTGIVQWAAGRRKMDLRRVDSSARPRSQ